MKVCLVGEGAQGVTHMQALAKIPEVEVVSLAGGIERDTAVFAEKWNIPHYSLDIETCLAQPGVEAAIIGSPSQDHPRHAELALRMGKHVLLEIPMALSLADSEKLAGLEAETGLTCMVCHTRHYLPPLRELRRKVAEGELHLHHIVIQTYFFRRENLNRFGQPRTWKDDLLWHHACHAVDLVYWMLDDPSMRAWGQVGPNHPELDIPMDLSIGLASDTGCIATIAHSFNHHGEITTPIRFIGEEASYLWDKMTLSDHQGKVIMTSSMQEAVVAQDREFLAAVKEKRPAETSFSRCLPSMRLLDRVQQCIDKRY